MTNNQQASYKWLPGKFTPICLVVLASSLVLISCQSTNKPLIKILAKKPLLAKTPIPQLNSSYTNPVGLECRPTITNGVVSLDQDIVPVWSPTNRPDSKIFPDAPTKAYRLGAKTCIHITHHIGSRLCGSSLAQLNDASEVIYRSPENKTFPQFDYHNWLFSPYILDDHSLVALAHSEWYGCLKYSDDSPLSCKKSRNQTNIWANAITLYQSGDNGASWSRIGIIERPESYPESFKDVWPPKMINFGFFHPSNIIREGNRYYAFVRYSERDTQAQQTTAGMILLSTTHPRSLNWEQVTPQGELVSQPYKGSILPGTSGWTQLSVTWNTAMCRYLILFWDAKQMRLMSTTTATLAKPAFSTPVEVQNQEDIQIPNNTETGLHGYNYPVAQLDPDSLSNNFETTDASFFVFMNSFIKEKSGERSLFRVTARLVNDF
jgi:hypothetical protein